jgi:hypothetical protein
MPARLILTAPELFLYTVAGVGGLAPFYLLVPGAEERLASQTAIWAPRWEKNLSYFTPTVERGVHRVEPPVSRTVRRIEHRLPLERVAQRLDVGIKNSIERANKHRRPSKPLAV